MLGFDVLNIANEGKFVVIVHPDSADKCLETCQKHPLGKQANIIGRILKAHDEPVVEMITKIGGRKIVHTPYGEQLPRIC